MTGRRTGHGSAQGSALDSLYLRAGDAVRERARARDLRCWTLTPDQLCDVELLLNGSYWPLDGFMGPADYTSVVERMRLADGRLWPIPVTLTVPAAMAESIGESDELALADESGRLVATMAVSSVFRPERMAVPVMPASVAGRSQEGAEQDRAEIAATCLGGKLKGIAAPTHYDFKELRLAPRDARERFDALGWRRVVGFHTRAPMHRAEVELTLRAMRDADAGLLIQALVDDDEQDQMGYFSRIRCYEQVLGHYPASSAMLGLLPLAHRARGTRAVLLHALVSKNFGCTHLIMDAASTPLAGAAAQSSAEEIEASVETATPLAAEIGIALIPFRRMVYVPGRERHVPENELGAAERGLDLSAHELHRLLEEGAEIPAWFSFPGIIDELRRAHPPRRRQGFTVFLTGLSGAGKSTLARVLMARLLELGDRHVTLLDGDIVRRRLSSELGFSREHRDLNILRIGYVASQITMNGGVAICAPIAPYAAARREVRQMIEPHGGFVEVHVCTPMEVCEQRDHKGLYAKARAGLISAFTGVDDPYEVPSSPELRIDSSDQGPEKGAERIMAELTRRGFIGATGPTSSERSPAGQEWTDAP